MISFSRICVFCGSSPGTSPAYIQAAQALGRELAQQQIGLVYGGGSIGLMGAVARAMESRGGDVTGIIPAALVPKEVSGTPIGRLEIVDSMHERQARMGQLADGFIALPGGFGTFEELFVTITWFQLGIHAKPIGMLNVAGYFDPLRMLIERAVEAGFIRPAYLHLLVVSSDPADLLDRMATHEPPESVVQWVTPEQT